MNGDTQQEALSGWVKVLLFNYSTTRIRTLHKKFQTLEEVKLAFPTLPASRVFPTPGEQGVFTIHADDVSPTRVAVPGLGIEVVGPFLRPTQHTPPPTKRQPPEPQGPTANNWTPVDPPEMKTARASQTREELARNLSSIRSRIANIVPADVLQGNVSLTDDGKIKVAEKQKRVYRKASEKLKEKLVNPKFNSGIAEQIADCLLLKTGGLATQLTNEVSSLRMQQVQLNVELLNRTSFFQLERFMNSCTDTVKKHLELDSSERKKTFKLLASLLNVKGSQLETDFMKMAGTVLDSFFGVTTARAALQETITKLVSTSGLLETKAVSLAKIGTDWKSELLTKVEDHLIRIAEADFVKKISFSGGTITVLVGTSVVKYAGLKYFIGDLEIRLHLVEKTGRQIITFYNTTIGTASEYHYPHIKAYGESVCWGTAFESAHNLFSDWNWTVLIGFLWKFLTTYNDKSKFIPLPDVSIIAVRKAKKNGIPIPEGCVGT